MLYVLHIIKNIFRIKPFITQKIRQEYVIYVEIYGLHVR